MAKKKTKTAEPSANGAAPKPSRPRLPGMEPDRIPELDTASEAYVRARDSRMAYGVKENEYAAKLTELMHKHKLTAYEDAEERIVKLGTLEKIKVAKKKEKDDL